MKNTVLQAVMITLLFLGIAACKKSTSTDGNTVTPPPVLGKWFLDSVQYVTAFNGQTVYNTYYRSATDYYDFRTDGKVYILYNNTRDTAYFTYMSGAGTKAYIRYNSFIADTIVTLNSSKLELLSTQGGLNKLYFHK